MTSFVDLTLAWLASHITTSTTTLIKTGVGVVHGVTVNTKGSAGSTVKVYDGIDATGVLLATIDSFNLSGSFLYDIACQTGLTVVTTNAPDITVSYR